MAAPVTTGTSRQQAPSAAPSQAPSSVVPFRRGSGRGRYTFGVQSGVTLSSVTQDIGPIDIKAYDYMRSILLQVKTTAVGTGTTATTLSADGPFNFFTHIAVKQPNGQTMYEVSSGHHAAMIHKWGIHRRHCDPRADPNFAWALGTSGTGLTLTMGIRIPFELDLRDALGSLPNKDAAAPFQLELTVNSLANVFDGTAATSPTFTVTPILEAYDQPPTTLDGQSVQTEPPNKNTLQRWTEQNITMSTGQFDARVRKLGNYVRELIPIMKNSSSVRQTASAAWADPTQIVLDEDTKDNISVAQWQQDMYEAWGYGQQLSSTAANTFAGPHFDSVNSLDTGVFPYQYFMDQRSIAEDVDAYLPTIESEDYLFRGSWASSASKMVVLVGEVLPQGDIFS